MSRWTYTEAYVFQLHTMIQNPVCMNIHLDLLLLGAAQLATLVLARLGEGFRSGMITAYSGMFRKFGGFVVAAGLALVQVTTLILLAFQEYLKIHQFKYSAIVTYVTAIRTMLLVYGQSTQYFRHRQISLFFKAIKINRPFQPKVAPFSG